MNTKKILFFLSVLFSLSGFAQNWEWSRKIGGVAADECTGTAVDDSGNVYATGYFKGTIFLDSVTSVTAAGHYDVFLAKYDPLGNLMWAKSAGGAHNDYAYGVAISGLGRVCITGSFTNNIFFTSFYGFLSAGGYDIFVAQYDTDGHFISASRAGGSGDDVGKAITCFASGDIYIAAVFSGTITFDNSNISLMSMGDEDVLVAKFSQFCIVQWAQKGGGIHPDEPKSIGVDGMGDCYVTGSFNGGNYFSGSATFGTTTLQSAGQTDVFLSKYDPNGNFLWAKRAGGMNYDVGNGLCVNFLGECFVTGSFSDTAMFGNNSVATSGWRNIFLAKYDPLGNNAWVKQIGSASGHESGQAICRDISGNLYITGRYADTSWFGQSLLSTIGGNDIFVSKYDPNGNCLWGKSAGSVMEDNIFSVAVSVSGELYVGGSFNDSTAVFDTISFSSAGGTDGFLSKLSNAPTGIDDQDRPINQTILVFPNPFHETATMTVPPEGQYQCTLYDAAGNEVRNFSGQDKIFLSKGDLPAGIYSYRLIKENGEYLASGILIIQ